MGVYEQWNELVNGLTEKTSADFEKEYYSKEQAVYQAILADKDAVIEGTFDELAQRFSFSEAMFAGFVEGINTSLTNSVDIFEMTLETPISLQVDFEMLYENMLKAKASWLYNLPEWDGVLEEHKRKEITRHFQLGLQAKSEKIDRNALCPCGSGKKYKKCCGANI